MGMSDKISNPRGYAFDSSLLFESQAAYKYGSLSFCSLHSNFINKIGGQTNGFSITHTIPSCVLFK